MIGSRCIEADHAEPGGGNGNRDENLVSLVQFREPQLERDNQQEAKEDLHSWNA
jgi:hypothetical protein